MAAKEERRFGETVRQLRQAKNLGLREFAKQVGISPTYLSKIERDEFNPPAEEKVRAIAKALGQDEDEMLALAGKVSSDLPEIIRSRPREMAMFLRTVTHLTDEEIRTIIERARKRKRSF